MLLMFYDYRILYPTWLLRGQSRKSVATLRHDDSRCLALYRACIVLWHQHRDG